jgi:hypothetical protein
MKVALRSALVVLMLSGTVGRAQQATADRAPLEAVERFLAALKTRDTSALRAVLHPSMRLMTATAANGGNAMALSGDDFVRAVGRATGDAWNQRLLAPEVHADSALATVWSMYRFDRGAVFDHCGAIAVHLVRIGVTWKIVQLSDTHRTVGCGA